MKLLMSVSGKGGVGKSLVAANLAYKLVDAGKKVALIDVDYSNPNLAEVLGVTSELKLSETKQEFEPIVLDNGTEFFSMAGICKNRPVSMEGSMYSQILRDILQQKWNADIGILDMPAGIADQFLEVINVFAEDLLGSVVVFQPAHIKSARRLLTLHKNEGLPVIGLIENMSFFRCPSCGEKHYIFGKASVKELAEEFGVPALGSIPLSMEIRVNVEHGKPMLPNFVACPACGEVVKSQGKHGHFGKAHAELDYEQFKNDFEPSAIDKTVELILKAKPLGVSFAEKIKEKLKGFARNMLLDVVANVVEIANTELNLTEIQERHALPGNRICEIDLTDETLRQVKVQVFMRLEKGAWKVVKNPKVVHDEVRVWDRASIWALLGYRADTGAKYDLMDSWLSGKAKYYSLQAGTQRALRLIRDIWTEVGETEGFSKLRPILEKIA